MAAEAPLPDAELDCRGLLCPLPVLKTREALEPMASGEILRIVTTDPVSVLDMAAFRDETGHELIDQSSADGEYVFFFRRK